MPGIRRRHHKEHKDGNRIARITALGLGMLIAFLLVTALGLILGVGDFLFPGSLIEYRNSVAGVLLFIVIILMLLSPIIVDFNSNPRQLSGPGKDPRQGWGP
jgi:uncharacterized RDD family membrane protein YckC